MHNDCGARRGLFFPPAALDILAHGALFLVMYIYGSWCSKSSQRLFPIFMNEVRESFLQHHDARSRFQDI